MFDYLFNKKKLFTIIKPKSSTAESYRTLRTNISLSFNGRSNKVILITSPGLEAGKSEVTANLGVVMAQAGSRVLIVNADMRNPGIHEYFNTHNNYGLSNLLAGDLNISKAVQKTSVEGLWLITGGAVPHNPSELLCSHYMREFVDKISELYDIILMDAPPVLAVTDSTLIASLVDGVIIVVKKGVTGIDMARNAKYQLQKAGAGIIGVVLKDVKIRKDDYRYYHYQVKKRNYSHGDVGLNITSAENEKGTITC